MSSKYISELQQKNKEFLRHTKAERIYNQETCTIWNVKESPSGRKKIPSDWNMALYKGPEKLRYDNCVVECKKDFLFKIWRPFNDI